MARPGRVRVLWGAPEDASAPVKRTTRKELTKLYGGDKLRTGFLQAISKGALEGDIHETMTGRRSRGGYASKVKRPKS